MSQKETLYLKNLVSSENFVADYKTYLHPHIGKGKASVDTLENYFVAIEQYLTFCRNKGVQPLQANNAFLLSYHEHLHQKGYKKASINLKFVALRRFYHVAKLLFLIAENPCKNIPVNNLHEEFPRKTYHLTKKQLENILEKLPQDRPFLYYRNALFISLMALDGLRCSEIANLSLEDVDAEHGVLLLRKKKTADIVSLQKRSHLYLQEYLKCTEEKAVPDELGTPLFLSDANNSLGKRLSRRGIRYILNRILRQFGLKEENLSCYLLRRTCGSLVYASTNDLEEVRRVLRHHRQKGSTAYLERQNRLLKRYAQAQKLSPHTVADNKVNMPKKDS